VSINRFKQALPIGVSELQGESVILLLKKLESSFRLTNEKGGIGDRLRSDLVETNEISFKGFLEIRERNIPNPSNSKYYIYDEPNRVLMGGKDSIKKLFENEIYWESLSLYLFDDSMSWMAMVTEDSEEYDRAWVTHLKNGRTSK